MNFMSLLPLLLSVIGRGKPTVENPIKDVIDIIGNLTPDEQEETIEAIDIRKAQELLASKGFDPGPIDGRPGSRTRAAAKAYQEAHGLEADGLIGQKTWASLNS
jgi:peptidoglycan hydrolase-like protein with peptidoglycan-binding domain